MPDIQTNLTAEELMTFRLMARYMDSEGHAIVPAKQLVVYDERDGRVVYYKVESSRDDPVHYETLTGLEIVDAATGRIVAQYSYNREIPVQVGGGKLNRFANITLYAK